MPRLHPTICPLCEAGCGIVIEHEGAEIRAIRGDPEDTFSQGHICPKAVALQDLHQDPDRLRAPMKRVGDRWEEIGWEEALDLACDRIVETQAHHGRHAVGVYVGNPTVHNYGALLFMVPFWQMLRTHNRFSATSVDQLPRMFVSYHLYGHQLSMPVPDVDNTSFFLMLGANPLASNGSLMTAPGIERRLKALKARGGRLVVVDPRRTETADLATDSLFIRPGTDAFFLAALLNVILSEGLDKPGRLRELAEGYAHLPGLVGRWTPEAVAPVTGIPAETTRALARDLAAAPTAVVYGRVGACTQRFGGLTTWLCDALNVATGNLDRVGGSMFTTPAFDLVDITSRAGHRGSFDRGRSRVRGLPEFGGELPVAALAEEIETPGDKQIHTLITFAGNPVLSCPDGERLDRALGTLDFMISIDPYLNETTRHAHLILPPPSPLERDHYDAALLTYAVRNVARFGEATFAPPAGAHHDWQILLALTAGIEARRGGAGPLKGWLRRAVMGRLGPRGILDLGLRLGPHGGARGLSLAKLRARPHGIDLGALEPRMPGSLKWTGGKIQLCPEVIVKDLDRLGEDFEARLGREGAAGLRLIGRRGLRDNNSWMHNSQRLVKGKERCTLWIHPADASRAGLTDGARARIRSRVGEVEAPVFVTDEIMPGVVSLPHGFGHHKAGTRLRVAAERPGVSINDLTDAADVDHLTGTAVLNDVPVEVHPA